MTGKFNGKVALVTGGSSGLGRAASRAFAREGAKVGVIDMDVTGGDETVQLIKRSGGEAVFIKADVSKAAEVEAMVNKIVELYGRLDYAYNNAGVLGFWGPITDCPEEMWDKTIDVNLKGIWLCMKYEVPAMLKNGGGAIVNASSEVGQKGNDISVDYCVSKFGVIGLTKATAITYAKHGIRINAVCPALIDTPMTNVVKNALGDKFGGIVEKSIPAGRQGTPEEVAAGVIWLCSDEASFVTGIAMPIDGGAFAK